MQGALEAFGHAAADDLLGAAFLTGTHRGRGLAQGLLGFVLEEAAGGHEATEGVGGPVEGVGETGALRGTPALLDRGQDRGQDVGEAGATAARGKDGLLRAGRDRAGGGDGGGGQVTGAFEFLREPGR